MIHPAPPVPPRVAATCYESRVALGTDNIPVSNGLATSVVDIWAILATDGTPVAWIFQNERGEYWVQRKLWNPFQYDRDVPRRIKSLHAEDEQIKKDGAQLVPCFTARLRM